MSIKRIEMEWSLGTCCDLFKQACCVALKNRCDNVVFEFNGGMFSVSRDSVWSGVVEKKLQTFPRQQEEVKL